MERKHNLINLWHAVAGDLSRLRFIIRFSNCPRIHNESVAEHSFYTALYTYLIGKALHAEGVMVDLGVACGKALMHDVDECFSGDFIRMFKHSSPSLKLAIDNASSGFTRALTGQLGMSIELAEAYHSDWLNAKKGQEGKLVSFADYLSVLSYVAQEIDSGNHRMRRQIPELKKFHSAFKETGYEFLATYIQMAGAIVDALDGQNFETPSVDGQRSAERV